MIINIFKLLRIIYPFKTVSSFSIGVKLDENFFLKNQSPRKQYIFLYLRRQYIYMYELRSELCNSICVSFCISGASCSLRYSNFMLVFGLLFVPSLYLWMMMVVMNVSVPISQFSEFWNSCRFELGDDIWNSS